MAMRFDCRDRWGEANLIHKLQISLNIIHSMKTFFSMKLRKYESDREFTFKKTA